MLFFLAAKTFIFISLLVVATSETRGIPYHTCDA